MPAITSSRYTVSAGWNDAPHLSEKAKAELLSSIQPHLREARSIGTPSMGAGAIYPIALSEHIVQPFPIPAYWPRAYGFDVGWNRTAALWCAKNPDTGVYYFYAEHYRAHSVPTVHATSIKARGNWIRGAIDPASRNRDIKDGERIIEDYNLAGLKLVPAINAVEAGIYTVWSLLEGGRIKVFASLTNFAAEYRLYRRDEKGKIIKKFDHLMDCGRYVIMTWDKVQSLQPMNFTNRGVETGPADMRAGI